MFGVSTFQPPTRNFYHGALVAANKTIRESFSDMRPSSLASSSALNLLAGSDLSEPQAPSPAAIQSISSMKITDGA